MTNLYLSQEAIMNKHAASGKFGDIDDGFTFTGSMTSSEKIEQDKKLLQKKTFDKVVEILVEYGNKMGFKAASYLVEKIGEEIYEYEVKENREAIKEYEGLVEAGNEAIK